MPGIATNRVYGVLADAVHYIHMALVAYLMLGWLSPVGYLLPYLALFPSVVAGWQIFGMCVLTKWEHQLRGDRNVESRRCIGDNLARLGIRLSIKQLDAIEYILPTTLWCVALWRKLTSL
jgi:hypothetical protein